RRPCRHQPRSTVRLAANVGVPCDDLCCLSSDEGGSISAERQTADRVGKRAERKKGRAQCGFPDAHDMGGVGTILPVVSSQTVAVRSWPFSSSAAKRSPSDE